MDNSFTRYYQSINDRSPLRRSDIPERETLYRGTNEKRYPVSGHKMKDEEDEYNRRREEEIRKQIQAKDDKLYNLHKAQDYLKNKMDQQPAFHHQEPRMTSSYGKSLPERDRSPYQIREEPSSVPNHIKEHLANLQSDNSSLMRRLNLVLQELDRVQKEKEELIERLDVIQKDQNNIQRMLQGEDKFDKVNRYMQDDLVYEKERNAQLSQKVKEEENYKNELLRELRLLESDQDNTHHQNQACSSDLHKKVNLIQDLEKEHYYTQEKIRQVGTQIEQIKRSELGESGDIHELQRLLNQLHQERNELLSKLDNLTQKYDVCVKDITYDRMEIESHNRRHSKLVTAKILFQHLQGIHLNKLRQGFQEMRSYCQFDSNCHRKLATLAKNMENIGINKMKIAFTKWFSNCLNPMKVKYQSELLSQKSYNDEIKLKFFCLWRQQYQLRINKYDLKTKAIQQLFLLKEKDSHIEIKRSFTIWKDCLLKFNLQKTRVKKLIWKLYFSKVNLAMNAWMNHSANLDCQVRLNLLAQKFSHKQYLTILFNNFKYQVSESKRKKQNVLFHVLKAWKDYLNHKKYLMCASVSAMHFAQSCNTTVLKQCFDAFRQHKEQQKYEKVFTQLNDVELIQIDQLTNEIDIKETESKFKVKNKACECVKAMCAKSLYGYFQQWKQVNEDYKEKLRSTVKDKIIKMYMTLMRSSFKQWRMNADSVKLQEQQLVVQDFQADHNNASEEIMQVQKDVKDRKQQRDCHQKKHLLRCVASYERRMIEIATGRWKDNINSINAKEDGAGTVIKRLRTRFLRQAFDLYLKGVKYHKKRQIEEERVRYYNQTRDMRMKRQVYKSWCLFKQTFQKQKGYWHRIYLRLETTLKERSIRKWREQTQKILEQELKNTQNHTIAQIDELNKDIGELSTSEATQVQDIKTAKGRMTKQAQRVIANTFARYYYIGETRGFEKWKDFVAEQKRKERIMKKMIDHWKKYQFNYVKSSLKNWMANANIQEKKDLLKKEEQKLKDAQFQFGTQNKAYSQVSDKLQVQHGDIVKQQQLYNNRLQKSIKMIVNNVDTKDYMSKKRFILQQWRDYVKREKHFILCVQNVIQKSLWTKGFSGIKECSRQDQRATKVSSVLEKFRMKFWKRTCGNAFSKWRSGLYVVMTEMIDEISNENDAVVESQFNKKTQIKDHNAVKSGKFIGKNQLLNVFQAWGNVAKFLKLQRIKDEQLIETIQDMKKKYAVQKWNARKNATKIARMRIQRLQEKFTRVRKMLILHALRERFINAKNFLLRISNLANIHDQQALKLGYTAVQSYVRAKNYVHNKKKEHATKDINSIFSGLLIRRMTSYFNDLKYRTNNRYKQDVLKAFTLVHNLNNKTRAYFLRWKETADNRALAQELHDEGPIREEVFEHRQILENCKNFMRDEGYNDRDIQQVLKGGSGDKKGLLLKGVRRMQHYNEELYVVPKAFDQWKKFVHLKKLFRYWLNYSNRRVQYIKSDMASAFDRWKQYDLKQKETYKKMPKRSLDQKTLVNAEQLDKLAEAVDEREQVLDNMNNQRDALLENYIKGQKLALCVWRNNVRLMLDRGFTKWVNLNQKQTNKTYESQVKKNIEAIAAIKNKLAQLERDNEAMANENEELRQFSLDGYQIAKSVNMLTSEREKLSVDLADKAQTIKKLLDENEKLHSKLKFAQGEAQSLIRSTNKYMGASASTGMGMSSPHMRHSAF